MKHFLSIFVVTLLIYSCQQAPAPYVFPKPKGFLAMKIPLDNPTTVEGVRLGRKLFFDPILSAGQGISCGHCHRPELAFTDGRAKSVGINGRKGHRSAPSLLNVGYRYKGLFWDGRSPSLENQALHPLSNPVEMGDDWPKTRSLLQNNEAYQDLFYAAFKTKKISKKLVAKALAQFQRTLISSDSKFDKVMGGEDVFTKSEKRGWTIFFDAGFPDTPMAECNHCHPDPLFTNLSFANTGLDSSETLLDFPDAGRGESTGQKFDNGKFQVPTLRNIAMTAPYMHDGRFETLEEVIDHYNSGGHYAVNVDPNVRSLNLSEQDKNDLIRFLKTLTDSVALHNKASYYIDN